MNHFMMNKWAINDAVVKLLDSEHAAVLRALAEKDLLCPRVGPEDDGSIIFRALGYFAPAETRVVILGQDPYHTKGKACGLSFGIARSWAESNPGKILYSSFGNVWAEATGRTEISFPEVELEQWARQGVLLLNTQLTVEEGKPLSHAGMWDEFVAAILQQVPSDVAWLAWGTEARAVAEKYAKPELLISTSHPCKYSATRGNNPFVGSKCFDKANEYLTSVGKEPIKWT